MPFDDPQALFDELQSAIQLRMKHDDFADERVSSIIGSNFIEGWGPDIESHENVGWDYVQNILGATNFYNPQWVVSSARPVVHRQLCEALKHYLNRWTSAEDLVNKLEPGAIDAACGFTVFATKLEPSKANPAVMVPRTKRLPRKRYFRDLRSGIDDSAYEGILWVKPRAVLENAVDENGEPKYNLEGVKDAADMGEVDRLGGVAFDKLGIDRYERDDVIGGEMWCREDGMIYEFCCDPEGESAQLIREPVEYFGPDWGPYTLGGFFFLPDQPYPLPPLAISQGLASELNAHVGQMTDQADQMRNVTIFNSINSKLGAVLKRAKHGSLNGVPGFDPSQVHQVILDAPDPKQMEYVDRLRARLDRKSGATANRAGELTGATAEEVATVNAGDDQRRRLLQKNWNRVVQKIGQTVAWYAVHSWSIEQKLSAPLPDSPPGSDLGDATFYGGVMPDEENPWEDLEISTQMMSMEYVSGPQRQAQMQLAFQIITTALPLMVQFPFVNWRKLLGDYFQALNIADGAEYVNFAMLEMARMQVMQGDPAQDEGGEDFAPTGGRMAGAGMMGMGRPGAPQAPFGGMARKALPMGGGRAGRGW